MSPHSFPCVRVAFPVDSEPPGAERTRLLLEMAGEEGEAGLGHGRPGSGDETPPVMVDAGPFHKGESSGH